MAYLSAGIPTLSPAGSFVRAVGTVDKDRKHDEYEGLPCVFSSNFQSKVEDFCEDLSCVLSLS